MTAKKAPNPVATATKGAAKVAKAKKAAKAVKPAKEPIAEATPAAKEPRAAKEPKAKKVREGSKTSIILNLVSRPNGATLAELMAAAAWQKHSVRGFISGSRCKEMGLKIESSKREDGERVYKTA